LHQIGSNFCFDAFSSCEPIPTSLETLWVLFLAGHALFWGSIVNAAADGSAACYRRISAIWNNSAERQETV